MIDPQNNWINKQVGQYHLVRFLGRGNFGDVYLGEHVNNQSVAAVKLLRVRLTDKKDVKSFINEARMIRLVHPHIMRVLDFGITEQDLPFIVMEYAPNGTMRHRHQRGTRIPLATVVEYTRQVAEALQWSSDGQYIVSGSLDGTVQIWHVETGERRFIYSGHAGGVNALAWSPDDRYIASGARDNSVQIWNTVTGECVYTYFGHADWLMALS